MDKEIKFRQPLWDKHNKFSGWHYWGFMEHVFVEPITGEPASSFEEAKSQSQQFINQKDKDGKEGYFGDLVKWGKSIYEVNWNVQEGITYLIKRTGSEQWNRLAILEIKRGEIIGNSTTSEKHELMK